MRLATFEGGEEVHDGKPCRQPNTVIDLDKVVAVIGGNYVHKWEDYETIVVFSESTVSLPLVGLKAFTQLWKGVG